MTGCCAKATPAVAVEEGCVWITSLLAAPRLTEIGLVLGFLVPSLKSLAVTVCAPRVRSVTLAVLVPADNEPLEGKVALVSLEVIPTVWMLLTRFQSASTDRTVTLKAVPAGCAVGVPVLPLAVPGAAVSPGTNSCSFTKFPALIVTAGLVLAVLVPSLTSLAVNVAVPPVCGVTLNIWLPAISGVSSGNIALASEEAMSTVSATVVTVFQFASTALTVTLNGELATWVK